MSNNATFKSTIIKVNNADIMGSRRNPQELSRVSIDESSEGIIKMRYYDTKFSGNKIVRNASFEITIPSIIGKDKHYENVDVMIDRDFLNVIFRKFRLGYDVKGKYMILQEGCQDFYERYMYGKENIEVYSVDKNELVGKWHKIIPSFKVVTSLPFFYMNHGSEYHSYNYSEYLCHDVTLNLNYR